MEPVNLRLKAIREEAELTVRALAELLDMPPSTYAAYEDRAKFKKPFLPLQLAQRIAAKLAGRGIDPGRVLALAGLEDAGGGPISTETIAEQLGLLMIPECDITFALGGGSVIGDFVEERFVPFRRDWLTRYTRGRPSDVFLTRGEGDSMVPTIMDGDDVLVNRAERVIDRQDGIWALAYGDLGMIKRVRRLPDGQYQLHSDNPAVRPILAAEDELHVVGRVIWIGRRV